LARKKRHAQYSKKPKRYGPLTRWWLAFEYRHTTSALFAIVAFIILLDSAIVQAGLDSIQKLQLLGMLIGGAFYTSLFTTAPGIAILLSFSDTYSPLLIASVGAFGSVIGDLIILKIFEERIGYELAPLVKKFKLKKLLRKLRRKKERNRMTVLGMMVVASPLPDELGIGLLGISHLSTIKLAVITYFLKFLGILLLVLGITSF
jgi:hypothetical protein